MSYKYNFTSDFIYRCVYRLLTSAEGKIVLEINMEYTMDIILRISDITAQIDLFHPQKVKITRPDEMINRFYRVVEKNIIQLEEHSAYLIFSSNLQNVVGSGVKSLLLILPDTPVIDTERFSNIIVLAPKTDTAILSQNIHILLEETEKVSEAFFLLGKCLLNRSSINETLKTAQNILGNPLFISDSSTRPIAFSDIKPFELSDDDRIQNMLRNGFVTSEFFGLYHYKDLLHNIQTTKHAFIHESTVKGKKSRIIAKLIVNGQFFGWIVLFPAWNKFAAIDLKIVDFLANVLSITLEQNRIGFAVSYRENLLMELFSGLITTEEQFTKRAEGFGWILSHDYYTLAIQLKDQTSTQSITAYKNHLAMIFPTFKAISINDTLMLLLETDNIESVISTLIPFLKGNNLIAGCSAHFSSIIDFRRSCDQASTILETARNQKEDFVIHTWREGYMSYLFRITEKSENLMDYCIPEVNILNQHDKKYGTQYIATLQSLLDHNGNALQTANALHIHRNTLTYRMEKIAEITHVKLSESSYPYEAWLSIKILKYLQDKSHSND